MLIPTVPCLTRTGKCVAPVTGVLRGINLCLIAQDYDFENTSPYGTNDQIYASAFNTWQIEEVGSFIESSPRCISLLDQQFKLGI